MTCVLIGLGMVAGTHLAALNASKHVSLLGVLGRDPAKTQTFAETHATHAFETLDAALAANPDFVIIATPPDARADIVQACAKARVPILMEKPIERTYAAAKTIVDTCAQANIPLGVVFCLLYTSPSPRD